MYIPDENPDILLKCSVTASSEWSHGYGCYHQMLKLAATGCMANYLQVLNLKGKELKGAFLCRVSFTQCSAWQYVSLRGQTGMCLLRLWHQRKYSNMDLYKMCTC